MVMDGIFIDGEKAKFDPLDIMSRLPDIFHEYSYETGYIKHAAVPYDEEDPTQGTEDLSGKYYLAIVPKIDKDGERVIFKVGISDETIKDNPTATSMPTKTTQQFAIEKMATVACNGGYVHYDGGKGSMLPWGVVIIDGEVYYEGDLYNKVSNPRVLGIMEDGSFRYYNHATTSAQEMVNDGVKYAVTGRYPLITNGARARSFSVQVPSDLNDSRRAIFGYDNNNYYIFVNDPAILTEDCVTFLLERGLQEAYLLDGGGSTSLNLCTVKMNTNKDEQGTSDRKLGTFIYASKQTVDTYNADVKKVAVALGEAVNTLTANDRGIDRILMNGVTGGEQEESEEEQTVVIDVNDLPINSVAYSYANTAKRQTINLPTTGGFWHILTFGLSQKTKAQLAIRSSSGAAYTRGIQAGTANPWIPINNKLGDNTKLVTGITNASTRDLAELGAISVTGYYMVYMVRTGTANNTGSIYMIHYDAEAQSDNFSARTIIFEGTAVSAPRLSATGVLTVNSSSSSQSIAIRVVPIYP